MAFRRRELHKGRHEGRRGKDRKNEWKEGKKISAQIWIYCRKSICIHCSL
jgi:hypothetical protein